MIDAASYGKALFELAAENGNDTLVAEQLAVVRTALEETPAYITLLDTPAVSSEEKCAMLRQAFGKMDTMLLNFLCILGEKRAFSQFRACESAYRACYDEAHDLLRATAITALPMKKRQEKALTERLAEITGKTILLECRVEPSLIGGITLRYGGVQLDDSIRGRLETMRRSLGKTIV